MTKHKILVVDDDRSVSTVVKITLEDMYDVATASNAAGALQYLAEREVDLVILDINMPGMNGIDALGEIKKRHPETMVIMFTSYASTENIQKATSLGAYGFIFKPFNLDSLRSYIDVAVTIEPRSKAHNYGPAHKPILQ